VLATAVRVPCEVIATTPSISPDAVKLWNTILNGRQVMRIEINPETERMVQEEIQRGHFRNVDELIVQAVQALREKTANEPPVHDACGAAEAVARFRALRKGIALGGLKIKDLAHEGHRF
jgi:Arc/MetJ-type ribon-helix-helix transcriptional regulator